mmetsp:Transcript_35391/g.102179  ORF Transcript_35391/g.102179 Transcript_35391/m.102179 type:complete len:259 (-) Transcript_35391:446-1222(-)
MESGPASGPKPCEAMASTRQARAKRIRREIALRKAWAASSGKSWGDNCSLSMVSTSSFRLAPARTAPRAARATWPWIDRGSKAGSRVPLTMAPIAPVNSSQPAHSTRPTARASWDNVNVPAGVASTSCHTAWATSKSSPDSPQARPSIGNGKNLLPSSSSIIPRPTAASLPFGAPSKNRSSADRNMSGVSFGPRGRIAAGMPPPTPSTCVVEDQFCAPPPGPTAASSSGTGERFERGAGEGPGSLGTACPCPWKETSG